VSPVFRRFDVTFEMAICWLAAALDTQYVTPEHTPGHPLYWSVSE